MSESKDYVSTFINPAGFIEQSYVGSQSPEDIIAAIKRLGHYSKKLKKDEQPVLIFVDVSRVKKVDLGTRTLGARKAGIEAMRSLEYKRAAVCGPLTVQILVTTLALVAGVSSKVKVFDNRVDAVRWLRSK